MLRFASCFVSRAVVDDDDLDRSVGLGKHARNRLAQQRRPVVDGNDGADEPFNQHRGDPICVRPHLEDQSAGKDRLRDCYEVILIIVDRQLAACAAAAGGRAIAEILPSELFDSRLCVARKSSPSRMIAKRFCKIRRCASHSEKQDAYMAILSRGTSPNCPSRDTAVARQPQSRH